MEIDFFKYEGFHGANQIYIVELPYTEPGCIDFSSVNRSVPIKKHGFFERLNLAFRILFGLPVNFIYHRPTDEMDGKESYVRKLIGQE